MKKLFSLLLLSTILCGAAWAQDEEENPVYSFKAQSSAVAGNTSYTLKDAEESLVATITYNPATIGSKDATTGLTTLTSVTESWSATKLSGFTVNGFTNTYYNATADNARHADPIAAGTVAANASVTSCPNTGSIKIVTEKKSTVIVYITGIANNKGILVVGGESCNANPTDIKLTSVSTAATEDDWKAHTNGDVTSNTLGATGALNVAVKFTAKAGVEYYVCGMGTKWRFVGLQVQQSASSEDEAKNIAWISSTSDPENSDMYRMSAPTTGFNYTAIAQDATDVTADSLRTFDAIVLSTDVADGNPVVDLVKQNIAFTPIVNLNNNIFGYSPVEGLTETTITVKKSSSELFNGLSIDEGVFDYASVVGSNIPEQFANDDVLATQGDYAAFMQHSAKRNSYLFMPFASDLSTLSYQQITVLLTNAFNMVAGTKKGVSSVGTPSIKSTYSDGATSVSISTSTADATIYYTTDGTDPTTESAVYSEPLSFTEGAVVKAFAVAEGFNNSGIARDSIVIKHVVATPAISASCEDGKTTLSASCATEGANLYYSFGGQKTAAVATPYTEPVTVTEPGTITVFAIADGYIDSQAATLAFEVGGIPAVKDTLAHFTANQNDWYTNAQVVNEGALQNILDATGAVVTPAVGNASAVYYYGKSAWNYYSTEVDHTEPVLDAEGNQMKCADGVTDSVKIIYKADANALKCVYSTADANWVIKSYGQVITGETQLAPVAGVGNGATGRYYDSPEDEIGGASTGALTMGGKTSGDPYSLSVESTNAYSGTFEVVTYLGNGGGKDIYVALQTSPDGSTWTTVDTLKYSATQRYIKKSRVYLSESAPVYVRVAHVGGGTKPQLYDIYVISTEGTTPAPTPAGLKGDVNGDGSVNISDVNAVISVMCGDKTYEATADVNGDGSVNISDVNAVITIMCGGSL